MKIPLRRSFHWAYWASSPHPLSSEPAGTVLERFRPALSIRRLHRPYQLHLLHRATGSQLDPACDQQRILTPPRQNGPARLLQHIAHTGGQFTIALALRSDDGMTATALITSPRSWFQLPVPPASPQLLLLAGAIERFKIKVLVGPGPAAPAPPRAGDYGGVRSAGSRFPKGWLPRGACREQDQKQQGRSASSHNHGERIF